MDHPQQGTAPDDAPRSLKRKASAASQFDKPSLAKTPNPPSSIATSHIESTPSKRAATTATMRASRPNLQALDSQGAINKKLTKDKAYGSRAKVAMNDHSLREEPVDAAFHSEGMKEAMGITQSLHANHTDRPRVETQPRGKPLSLSFESNPRKGSERVISSSKLKFDVSPRREPQMRGQPSKLNFEITARRKSQPNISPQEANFESNPRGEIRMKRTSSQLIFEVSPKEMPQLGRQSSKPSFEVSSRPKPQAGRPPNLETSPCESLQKRRSTSKATFEVSPRETILKKTCPSLETSPNGLRLPMRGTSRKLIFEISPRNAESPKRDESPKSRFEMNSSEELQTRELQSPMTAFQPLRDGQRIHPESTPPNTPPSHLQLESPHGKIIALQTPRGTSISKLRFEAAGDTPKKKCNAVVLTSFDLLAKRMTECLERDIASFSDPPTSLPNRLPSNRLPPNRLPSNRLPSIRIPVLPAFPGRVIPAPTQQKSTLHSHYEDWFALDASEKAAFRPPNFDNLPLLDSCANETEPSPDRNTCSFARAPNRYRPARSTLPAVNSSTPPASPENPPARNPIDSFKTRMAVPGGPPSFRSAHVDVGELAAYEACSRHVEAIQAQRPGKWRGISGVEHESRQGRNESIGRRENSGFQDYKSWISNMKFFDLENETQSQGSGTVSETRLGSGRVFPEVENEASVFSRAVREEEEKLWGAGWPAIAQMSVDEMEALFEGVGL